MNIVDRVRLSTAVPDDRALSGTEVIPAILHLIWLGERTVPQYCLDHVAMWKTLMPHWQVKLWRNDDVAEFSEEVRGLIEQAHVGAQKADILRAFVVEKYGGMYVDADTVPKRSLDCVRALNEPVVLCHDIPFYWPYLSSAFFAAAPHHPLLLHYCSLMLQPGVLLNTPDIHMHTGPRLLGEAVWTAPGKDTYYMLPSQAFYLNETTPDALGVHTYANTWGCGEPA